MHRFKASSVNQPDSTTTIIQEPPSDDRPGWHRSTFASTGGRTLHCERAAFIQIADIPCIAFFG